MTYSFHIATPFHKFSFQCTSVENISRCIHFRLTRKIFGEIFTESFWRVLWQILEIFCFRLEATLAPSWITLQSKRLGELRRGSAKLSCCCAQTAKAAALEDGPTAAELKAASAFSLSWGLLCTEGITLCDVTLEISFRFPCYFFENVNFVAFHSYQILTRLFMKTLKLKLFGYLNNT